MDCHRADITRVLTDGIDAETLDLTTQALVRMKAAISAETRAPRRSEPRELAAVAAEGIA